MMFYFFRLLVCMIIVFPTYSQQPILLQNPSFEDAPGASRMPWGWFYCGDMGESPPDVHPSGNFGVACAPKRGFTYIGMVVRDNNTREGVSQWLSEPLQAWQCYEFSLFAARSAHYRSLSRTTGEETDFNQPVRLFIWGGQLNCDRQELLAASPLIASTDWKEYVFHFQVHKNYDRLLIEAQYAEGAVPYCGNVLLDHASPLVPIDCNNQQIIAKIDTIKMVDQISKETLRKTLEILTAQVKFSTIDRHPEQHVFYLSSGELYQGNRYLYQIVQIMMLFPERKITFYIMEGNKQYFRSTIEALHKELMFNGLSYEQFVIKRLKKTEGKVGGELRIEVR